MVVECKEIIAGMVKILESKMLEIVEDPEPAPEVDDKLVVGPEVVAELVLLEDEIFSWPMEVIELPIKTLVNLSTESIMKLVPSLTFMRVSFFLRSPDIYNPCRSFSRRQFYRRLVLWYVG